MNAESAPKKTFAIYIPNTDDVTRVQGRMKAVREAKGWSREETYPVRVEREDGRVAMPFLDGQLTQYGFGRPRRGR